MSHVTDVKCRVMDLDALAEAAAECGLELRRGQRTFAWWGAFAGDTTPPAGRDPKDYGKCEHAIGRPGTVPRNGSSGEWEIGVVAALDGKGYDLLLDTYGTAGARLLEACGGARLDKLRREYAAAVAVRKAKANPALRGYTVTKTRPTPKTLQVLAVKR